MHSLDMHSKRKQKLQNQPANIEYLLLASEPTMHEYMPGQQLSFRYHSRYLAKRRVMRTIRRLKQI